MTTRTDTGVFFSCDDTYELGLAAALASLVRHGELSDQATIHVVTSRFEVDARRRVESAAGAAISWHLLDPDALSSLPTRGHLTPAVHGRLWGPELITSTRRLLYLDADVLVRRGVGRLLEMEIDGVIAAAQANKYPYVSSIGNMAYWSDLGLDPATPYFNSGVMVIDCERWMAESVAERTVEIARRYPVPVRFPGQDHVNAAIAGQWHRIGPEWNLTTFDLEPDGPHHVLVPRDQLEAARADPAIVHFTGPNPWEPECTHPRHSEWLDIVRTAVDPDWVLQRPAPSRGSLRNQLRRVARSVRARLR